MVFFPVDAVACFEEMEYRDDGVAYHGVPPHRAARAPANIGTYTATADVGLGVWCGVCLFCVFCGVFWGEGGSVDAVLGASVNIGTYPDGSLSLLLLFFCRRCTRGEMEYIDDGVEFVFVCGVPCGALATRAPVNIETYTTTAGCFWFSFSVDGVAYLGEME